MKQTKIVCTLGPASENPKTLAAMMKAGMNVVRLNFSHNTHEYHAAMIKRVREVSDKLGLRIAIMQDLQGPKIRVGDLKAPVKVTAGQKITIGEDFNMDFDISSSVKPGERVLIEDGTIELKVVKVNGKKIQCQVVTTGLVQTHKGINLPDSKVTFAILTKKDIEDLQFGLKQNVDFVALSFVRNRKDIARIKDLIKQYNPKGFEAPQVIAKIERPEAVENFEDILVETDAVMVARGDLGVEVPAAEVPILQKTIIQYCQAAAKPVIVATQMLDSMIRNPRPTRAEVSDVANAVIDQADAVMLSGESAFGAYPLEAVNEMARIIQVTENSAFVSEGFGYDDGSISQELITGAQTAANAVAESEATALVTITANGLAARVLAQQRSQAPIYAVTDNLKIAAQLELLKGVSAFVVDSVKEDVESVLKEFFKIAQKQKILKKKQTVIVAAGEALDKRFTTIEAVIVK
jgi:pyruvate kinase